MFSRISSDDSTIVELLASSLRRDIAFGTLLPDQKLKLNELRTRYGGSNHSMRETLRILSTEGLVEDAAATNPDDLVALEWDEACRAFSYALIDACDSPRLIDLQRKFFDQSRRFRLAQMREGRLDWAGRKHRQNGLLDEHDTSQSPQSADPDGRRRRSSRAFGPSICTKQNGQSWRVAVHIAFRKLHRERAQLLCRRGFERRVRILPSRHTYGGRDCLGRC